jgi:hypothetical protein
MDHFGNTDIVDQIWPAVTFEERTVPATHHILIVREPDKVSDSIALVCEFLDIVVEHITPADDLRSMLEILRPMAVITDLSGEQQDGFHVLKLTASYDPSLPVLMLTEDDPALLGALDAVQEVWGLTQVATASLSLGVGALVDFVCHAARSAGRPRLMRV